MSFASSKPAPVVPALRRRIPLGASHGDHRTRPPLQHRPVTVMWQPTAPCRPRSPNRYRSLSWQLGRPPLVWSVVRGMGEVGAGWLAGCVMLQQEVQKMEGVDDLIIFIFVLRLAGVKTAPVLPTIGSTPTGAGTVSAAGVTCVLVDPSYRFSSSSLPTCTCSACLAYVTAATSTVRTASTVSTARSRTVASSSASSSHSSRHHSAASSRGGSPSPTRQGVPAAKPSPTKSTTSKRSNGAVRHRDLRKTSELDDALFKTALCKRFSETGYCAYGDECGFAHGEGELRKLSAVERANLASLTRKEENGTSAVASTDDSKFNRRGNKNRTPGTRTPVEAQDVGSGQQMNVLEATVAPQADGTASSAP